MKSRAEIREVQLKLFEQAYPDFQQRLDKILLDIDTKIEAIDNYIDLNVNIALDIYRDSLDNKSNVNANRKLLSKVAKVLEQKQLTMTLTAEDELSVYWG